MECNDDRGNRARPAKSAGAGAGYLICSQPMKAIVTLEDGGQETVLVGDLEDPTISVGTRTWPSGDVPPSLGDWGMATKPKFSLALAEVTGKSLIQMLADTCERIEMAGSVRRQVFEVGDIELLCVPKAGAVDLFGEPVTSKSMLDLRCRYLIDQGVLAPRPNKVGTVTIGPLNKLLVHPATGIGVDIFATSAENWGMAMVARTGPVGFKRAGHGPLPGTWVVGPCLRWSHQGG